MPSNNPEYQRKYIKEHYRKNKEYYKEKATLRNKKIYKQTTAFINRYKLWKGCVDCGYKNHPQALHFDHISGLKLNNVSSLKNYSLKKVKEEIRKCCVRCANCHAVVTAERREQKCLALSS